MGGKTDPRSERFHSISSDDQRSRYERDRDRILYSSAFRRLSGVTQIVRAGEADVFHTRQQHTLKVAQVGRRLAQHLKNQRRGVCAEIGLDEEVVEAACLAHDLGHPPFGHVGEDILDELITAHGDPDGYEGNAQSFRIVTKLAIRFDQCPGLDLTRATLAAIMKYPWLREPGNSRREEKWGAYRTEMEDFTFASQIIQQGQRSVEADIMDWADDVAFSVHDLEDFHRCNAIPWARILGGDRSDALISRAVSGWFERPAGAEGRLREALRELEKLFRSLFKTVVDEPYEASSEQRQQLRTLTSSLIGRYFRAFTIDESGRSSINQSSADQVRILKQITRDYIISNPSLSAQQAGQKRILRFLFQEIVENSGETWPSFLPTRLRYMWDLRDGKVERFAGDCIASLTEAEAIGLHARLTGSSAGSVLDPIVR